MENNNVTIDAITKEEVERWVNDPMVIEKIILSDTQWEAVKEEIEGRVSNYLDMLLADIVQDIREGVYDENN
jgi:uncharacterized circularly permuted ATP-grasp superfamily protein